MTLGKKAARKDVAREAGVSETSVSYYINQNGYVSKEAGERIQQAIEKLHYSPNQIARSLKTKTSNQFVFLCNQIQNPFFSQIVSNATEAAYKKGYSILFSNVIDDETYLRKLCSYQVDGIFIPSGKIRQSILKSLVSTGIPIVMLSDAALKNLPKEIMQIRSDAALAFPRIIQHLRENGYSRFHFISSVHDVRRGTLDDKVQAFLNETSLSPEKDVSYNVDTAAKAEMLLTRDWPLLSEKDAFLCANDSVAQGVIYALYTKGIHVPEDVGVVGYDNTTPSRFFIPEISSVDYDADKLGEMIIEMLIRRVQGKPVENRVITPQFIARRSTMRNG